MTLKVEYDNLVNSNTFIDEIPNECKPYIDSSWFNNSNNKYTVFWISPVPQNILDSFQVAIDAHDETKRHPSLYKLYRYTSKDRREDEPPHEIDFKTMLNTGLEKGEVIFDHKGDPVEVKYFDQGEEICKRTWAFEFFDKDTIMTKLSVSEAIANAMADDLVWTKEECFHWMKEDGTYSANPKKKFRDYVPFDQGVPDLAMHYVARKEERERGRKVILELLEVEVAKFIMDGGSLGLEAARDIGRAFLRDYSIEFSEYVKTGDDSIQTVIIADTTHIFLDYDTLIPAVTVRQWIVNRLRQVPDLTTPL